MTNATNDRDLLIFLRENIKSFGLADHLQGLLTHEPECVTELEGSDLTSLQERFQQFLETV